MDRQAFKNRMQKLKSYRENNPGKGYWDWKVSAFVDGGEPTDHGVDKPIIPQRVERIVNGKPWSQLTAKEQFMNRVGYSNGRPQEQGLEIISPEFDVLTGIRSVSTLPKKFLGSNKAIKDVSGNYYRQIDRSSKGIEHAKNSGMVTVNSSAKKQITLPNGQQINLGKTFDVPFWAKDNRWYPDENNIKDIIVSKGDVGLEWKPITQHGGFTTAQKAGSRRTPLFNGEINNTPSDLFEYYRHYPIVGFRNVTEGFPHIPISGINAVTENIDSFEEGGEVGNSNDDIDEYQNYRKLDRDRAKSSSKLGTRHQLKEEVPDLFWWLRGLTPLDYNTRFGGGSGGGAGTGSQFGVSEPLGLQKHFVNPAIPVEEDFNSAFSKARRAKKSEFIFNGKKYNTELGDNPKNYEDGQKRKEITFLPTDEYLFTNVSRANPARNDTITRPVHPGEYIGMKQADTVNRWKFKE